MKAFIVSASALLIFLTNNSLADFHDYTLEWYEKYKNKEKYCLAETQANVISISNIDALKNFNKKDVEAYAIKVGVEHKIKCTSEELVQVLHSSWVAHRDRVYDKDSIDLDYILDEIVDPRYLDAIIHLGGVSRKTLEQLDQIEYFQKPFDIESRPWE